MEWLRGYINEDVLSRLLTLVEYDAASPISLVSALFLLVFPIFGLVYMVVRPVRLLRTLYLVVFSLLFYYKLSGYHVILLGAVALSDYAIGHIVGYCRQRGVATRGWVALSVVIDVAILAYFKAANIVVEALGGLYDSGTLDWESVVVPAGLSFFIFQSIAYVVDISRGEIKPLRRFSDYLFLLSFFPKLFLGPLVKAREFIPQIESRNLEVSREDLGRAIMLIAGGLVKYAVIAKTVGALLVAPAFAGEYGEGGVVALMAIYGFTLQIYCDFSGYSDLAVGIALLLGFRLPDNFDAPYKSATITEFWRRWHISLSSWLRDYLYISLGGNRKGRSRTYFNLIVTMFLGGLWHGVGVTFAMWGLLHGVALALHKMWLGIVPWARRFGSEMHPVVRLFATLFTFHLVAYGWLLFTAEDMAMVDRVTLSIIHEFDIAEFGTLYDSATVALWIMFLGYLLHFAPRRWSESAQHLVMRSGFVGMTLLLVVVIWLVMQCDMMLAAEIGSGGGLPIYAAF